MDGRTRHLTEWSISRVAIVGKQMALPFTGCFHAQLRCPCGPPLRAAWQAPGGGAEGLQVLYDSFKRDALFAKSAPMSMHRQGVPPADGQPDEQR